MRWLIIILFFLTQCTSAEKKPEKTPPKLSKMDSQKINATIASHVKYIRHCYGETLVKKGNASLKGTVMVHFIVGPDGRGRDPKMVEEKSTLKNEALNQCLFAGITSWDFPVHPDGIDLDIKYPFQFRDTPPAGMQKTMDKFENLRTR